MNEYIKSFLDVATAVGAIATTFGVFFAYKQLKNLDATLQDSRKWNKVISAFNITLSNSEINSIEEELNNSFIKIIDRTSPLSSAEVDQIAKPENARLKILLKNYLNGLESYCTAVNIGAVCDETAQRKYSYKITRHFIELKPYIDRLRAEHNESSLFVELETVVSKWSARPRPNRIY